MTAVVVAGGRSRRIQTDKAFLDIGGKRLLDRVLEVIVPMFSPVYINSNTPELYREWGLQVLPDIFKDTGALGGMYTGLVHAATQHVFCVACDMPALNPQFIRYMTGQINGYDALIPRTPDGFHPLHAIYSTRCISKIEELLTQNRLKISHLFPKVRTGYVTEDQIRVFDPSFESFLNLNTWQDVLEARKRFEQGCKGADRK